MASASRAIPCAPLLLYVEDDKSAAEIFGIVLRDLRPATALVVLGTCEEALAFLHHQFPYENAPRPRLVILDIQLPDGTGFHILENIRSPFPSCRAGSSIF